MLEANIRSILRPFASHATALGGSTINKPELMKGLESATSHSRVMNYVAIAMAVVLFLVQVSLIISYRTDPKIIVALCSAIGVTAMGLAIFVAKIARETSQGAMMMLLSSQLSAERLANVVDTLVNSSLPPAK